MPNDVPADSETRDVFRQLSALVYAGADASSVHHALVEASVRLVDGCAHASLMLRTNEHFATVASTDEVATRIDQIEIEIGEGPCLDAILEEAYQHDADLTSGSSPWPRFTARILAETPVRSAIGYRLFLEGEKVGALNLFGDEPGCLTSVSADQGAVLASFASVSLMALRAREEADSLRQGLHSNREIGKAVGLLMAAHKVSADDAFAILKRTSQDLNMKLVHVAAQVVDGQQAQVVPKSTRP